MKMKIDGIRRRARALGINPSGKDRSKLIREIQTAEGNFPCFQTAEDFCDQSDCCWREDCLTKTAEVRAV